MSSRYGASLTSQVQVFTQMVLLENMPRKRCMSECVEACYSLDEMHETLFRKFGQSFKTTKNTYDYFLKGRKGSKAYKQLSLVRAAQRRAEKLTKAHRKPQLKVDKICEAVEKSKLEQKEQAGNQVQSNGEQKEQGESLLPIQDEVELPKLTEVQSNTEQKEQDGDQVQSSEHNKQAESLLPIQDDFELPKSTEVQGTSEQKEQAQRESAIPILTQVRLNI
ncbi:hypothetical protein Bca4012_081523 [Brassica carinata]